MENLEDLAKFPSENPNPVLRVTKNKVLYINKAGELLFSIKKGDLIPKLFQGELTEALDKNILKTLEIDVDNLIYIFDISPIREEGYANIYGRNITDRKTAENALKDSEEKLKHMIEALPIGISISNPEGIVMDINFQTVNILCYDSKKEFLSIPAIDHYYNPADRDLFVKMLQSGSVKNLELKFKRKDGTLFWGSVSSVSQEIGGQTIYINTFQDITDRKKVEKKVSDLAKFPSENPNPVLRVTKEKIIYTNRAGENLFRVKEEDMLPELLRTLVYNTIDKGVSISYEVEFYKKLYSLILTPIKEDGYVNIYGKDITEQKKSEYIIEERVKELNCLYSISKIAEDEFIEIEELLSQSVVFLPPAWQFPEVTCARIVVDGQDYKTENFKETKWMQGSDIIVDKKKIGTVEIYYLEEMPEFDEGPFLKEERHLIDSLAAVLGIHLERKNVRAEIVNLAKFPSENPNPVIRTTKNKILYSNKAGEDLFKIKEGSKVPHQLLEWVNLAIDLDTLQLVEIDFGDKTFSFNIISIKEEGYTNIYGRDMTKRKHVEIKLQKSEATYREAYNRAEFYKDIFTHDINNILQNISNGIQLNEMYLNKPEKSDKVIRNIDIIKRQVKRGANLVSNIRKLSKISESETLLINVNCLEVLTKSTKYIKNAFQDKNMKIEIQIIESNYEILANELLEDVFDNILTNSINYNESEVINIEVKLTKELRQGTNYIKMQFIDNGIGITDERKSQIFIRGYSEETSVHGMGLGLSLVKKIIESYNGEIWMEDRVKGDYTKGNNCILLIPEVVNND